MGVRSCRQPFICSIESGSSVTSLDEDTSALSNTKYRGHGVIGPSYKKEGQRASVAIY